MRISMSVDYDGGTVHVEQHHPQSRNMCETIPKVDAEIDEVAARVKAAMRVQA